jgi:hypothetical protein
MKDVADFIRYLTPSLNDKQRFTYISNIHAFLQTGIVFSFFYFESIAVKLLILVILGISIYVEIYYKECPLSILEREFHNETWDDILDMLFKYFNWKITHDQKIVGFICFNTGIFIVFSAVIICAFFS